MSDWRQLDSTDFSTLSAGGISLYRRPIGWSEVELEPGRFDFSSTDAWVAAAARRGVRIQPILFGSPPWIASLPVYPPRGDRKRALFGRYVRAVVGRYGTRGSFWRTHDVPYLPIKSWQVWNEPHLRFFWGSRPNAAEYVQLARVASAAALSVDSTARILTASLTQNSTRYLGRVLRLPGARSLFDGVALNLYHRYLRSPRHAQRAALRFRRFVNRRGMRGKPLYITEFAWRSSGSRRSRKRQAARVSKMVRLLRRKRRALGLRSLIYFSYRDARYPGGGYRASYRTGLRTRRNRPKPAWHSYTRLARRWGR